MFTRFSIAFIFLFFTVSLIGAPTGNFGKFRDELRSIRTAEAAREYQIALKHYQNAVKLASNPSEKKRMEESIRDIQNKIKQQKSFHDQKTAEAAKNWKDATPVESANAYLELLNDPRLSVSMKNKIANDLRNRLNKFYFSQKDKNKGALPTPAWQELRLKIARCRTEWRVLNDKERDNNFINYVQELNDCNAKDELLSIGVSGFSRFSSADFKAQYMVQLMRAAAAKQRPDLVIQYADAVPIHNRASSLPFEHKSLAADAQAKLKNEPLAQNLYRDALDAAQEAGPKKIHPDQLGNVQLNYAASLLRSSKNEEFEKLASESIRTTKRQDYRRRWAQMQMQLAQSQQNIDKYFKALRLLSENRPNPRELNDARFRGVELLLQNNRKDRARTELDTLNRAPGINGNDRKRIQSLRERAK